MKFQALVVIAGVDAFAPAQGGGAPSLSSQLIGFDTEPELEFAIRQISGSFRDYKDINVTITRLQPWKGYKDD